MNRTWKLLLMTIAAVWLLAACTPQADVPESVAAVQEEEVVAVKSVTAVPNTPVPTETATIAPTETQGTAVETGAEQEKSIDTIEPPLGQTINEYTNVSYTQADADLIGKTNRAQFVLTYATW